MKQIINKNEALITDLSSLIDQSEKNIVSYANSGVTLLFWNIGKRVKEYILENKRAEYGKEVVSSISSELKIKYGKNFEEKNLRRMIQFVEKFPDFQIVATLSRQLSWSHFITLLPIKKDDARLFYANKISEESWSVRFTRKQIETKVFERSLIANSQLPVSNEKTEMVFKDPYILDFLGLQDGFLENDLEKSILKELEQFILELGIGFTFVERQKRMIIDGEDFYLDLLFYHRKLKRLVAIELKIGKFKASYKGQMELYLKWLNRYDRQEGENQPIGLILCPETSQEQIELLEMHKDGIMVAEYLTDLPPKEEFEHKLHLALQHAKEKIERKRLQLSST